MKISFYTLDSAYDDLKVSVVAVCPDSSPRAVLQLSHGMCGSKEKLMPFMKYLAGEGIACFANDHRGHGQSIKSSEDRGFMYDGGAEALVDDMKLLTDSIKEQYPSIPVFLLGHSMGSMAVRVYLKMYPQMLDGIIICGSPAYNPLAPAAHAFLSAACACGLGRIRPVLLQRLVSDKFNLPFDNEGPQAWICSDPVVRKEYLEDPMHSFTFTFNASRALLGLMLEIYSCRSWKNVPSDLPVLFVTGYDDTCAGGPEGVDRAVAVLHDAGYRQISSKIYPAMRHEILSEIGKERVWRDVLEFVRNC